MWNVRQGEEVLRDIADNATVGDFLSTIVTCINPAQFYLITSCENTKATWDNLKQRFQSDTLQNKLLLKKQYFVLYV